MESAITEYLFEFPAYISSFQRSAYITEIVDSNDHLFCFVLVFSDVIGCIIDPAEFASSSVDDGFGFCISLDDSDQQASVESFRTASDSDFRTKFRSDDLLPLHVADGLATGETAFVSPCATDLH